jgi:hypothetical protein
MFAEAGEDPNNIMNFIESKCHDLTKFEDNEEEETTVDQTEPCECHTEATIMSVCATDNKSTDQAAVNKSQEDTKGGTLRDLTATDKEPASKTQGPLPSAHPTSPAERAITEPLQEAGGDKEGVQSMSMADGE